MWTAIFDLDGTLADTSGDLLAAGNQVFLDKGYDAPLTESDFETALLGGRSMLHLGVERLRIADGEAFVEAGYQPLLVHYKKALCVKTKLYPDAMAVLERLRDDGWHLGVCTNKPIHLAVPLLSALGLEPLFGKAVIGAGSLKVSKPDPAPLLETISLAGGQLEHTVLIGDSATDYKTARSAGTQILLVDFEDTKIGEHYADAPVVTDFLALAQWLKNWRESAV